MVAGEDAEAARVDPERLVEAVLGAEVGDRARRAIGPCWRWNQWFRPLAMYASKSAMTVLVLDHEVRVVEEAPPSRPAPDEHGHRVAVAGPGRRVDAAEQAPGPRMPGPPQVVGEAGAGPRAGAAGGTARRAASGRGRGAPCAANDRASEPREPVRRGDRTVGSWRCECVWRCSPPSASPGPRPAASAMSSTRSPGRWAGCRMPGRTSRRRSTSSCPRYRSVPAARATVEIEPVLRIDGPGPPPAAGDHRRVDRERRDRRLPAPPRRRPRGVRPRRHLRLSPTTRGASACSAGRPSRRCGRTAGRSTCSTSTTGTPDPRCRACATGSTRRTPILGRRPPPSLTIHNLAYHGWIGTGPWASSASRPGEPRRGRERRRHRPPARPAIERADAREHGQPDVRAPRR